MRIADGLPVVLPLPVERSVYAPPAGRRIIALAGISLIYALVMAGFLLSFGHSEAPPPPSAPIVVDLLPMASPPDIPPEEKEAPKPVEKKEKPPEPREVPPIERTIIPIAPVSVPVPVATPNPVDPGLIEPETAAPRTQPAPPAPKVSSNAAETWEGKVLARLNEHRRYPRSAMAQREQGVPYIRFVMDREGRVLSATLERSSGFRDLDREAVALPRRAQPLPKPPDDMRPGQATIELVVPVEFLLR